MYSFSKLLFLILCPLLCAPAGPAPRQFELQALSPKFWALIDRGAQLKTVAAGFGFTEGPVWDPAGFVYVSDEEQNKIYRVYGDGRKETLLTLGDPDGSTFDEQRQLLDCASVLRAVIRVNRDGQYKILADRYEGKRFNSPNDVVIGPDHAIYFTDPPVICRKAINRKPRSREFTVWMQEARCSCW